jgi:hypothetical protein
MINLMHILALLAFIYVFTGLTQGESAASAEIIEVKFSGTEGDYTFNVTIKSPDTGCDQYADWWEVVTASGRLIYRRILAHSHVSEQPFTRPGGKVNISADEEIIVRVHMNNTGYGSNAMNGSVRKGFKPIDLEEDFAVGLESESPLPEGCAF